MTDKQIIIDGVDVSKCIYFQQEDDEYTCGAEECNGAIVACRACDNCYYKQLKRKEQECEELKEKYLKLKEQNGSNIVQLNTVNEQLDQLKAENEDLKGIRDRNFLHALEEQKRADKLSKTLTEIRELLLKTPTDSQEHCVNAKSVILQKISEVKK